MNWKEAKDYQLYEIAYNDTGCRIEHKQAAIAEIHRRKAAKSRNAVQAKIRRKRA